MKKSFFVITAVIFFAIAILHLLRMIYQWPAQIGSLEIPLWLSWIAFILMLLLGIWALKLLKHTSR